MRSWWRKQIGSTVPSSQIDDVSSSADEVEAAEDDATQVLAADDPRYWLTLPEIVAATTKLGVHSAYRSPMSNRAGLAENDENQRLRTLVQSASNKTVRILEEAAKREASTAHGDLWSLLSTPEEGYAKSLGELKGNGERLKSMALPDRQRMWKGHTRFIERVLQDTATKPENGKSAPN